MFSIESGQAAATRLIRRGITGSCARAIRWPRRDPGRAAHRRAVPADLSVVGYDDSAFMNCTDPPLTTVRQPIESMGRAAVELLVGQIDGAAVSTDELLFEPELVVRGSTGRAA
jgi:hypothetical protein